MILDRFLLRYKVPLLLLTCGYLIAAHALYLGFNSWDGLSYRVPPVVELVQHGDFGGWKFDYPPAVHFYPFFELLHVPFLKLFGLAGLYFSFSLTLLPLSVLSVYLFVRELTGDERWATYAGLTFIAIPFVNTQPFSGYIDFAVIGALAFFLYAALLALRAERMSFKTSAVVATATFIFSMSRQHAPYMALAIMGPLAVWYLLPWNEAQAGGRRVGMMKVIGVMLVFAVGLLPAALLHWHRYIEFGSPIYPYQFDAFGIKTAVGLSRQETARFAGLDSPDWRGLLEGFRRGWMIPREWPLNFYDSRTLGVGVLFWLGLILASFLDEFLRRDTGFLMLLFLAIAIALQDFWLPRWSMTLILAMVLVISGAIARFASHGPKWLAPILTLVVLAHLGRPIYDAYSMVEQERWYIRANLAGSARFIPAEVAPGVVNIYPDLDDDFVIVRPIESSFMLPLYGRRLTNRIVGVLDNPVPDAQCVVLPLGEYQPGDPIIDPRSALARAAPNCTWVCAYEDQGVCLAGSLVPPGS